MLCSSALRASLSGTSLQCHSSLSLSLCLCLSLSLCLSVSLSLCFSLSVCLSVTQNHQGQRKKDTGRPRLAQSAVVPNISKGTNAETRSSCQRWKNVLVLPTNPEAKHRLRKARFDYMRSMRKRLRSSGFFQLAQSYAHPGVAVPADNMPHTSRGGRGMQTNGVFIPFHHL